MRAASFLAFLSWAALSAVAARAEDAPENHSKARAAPGSENFLDAGSACVPEPKTGQMSGPHFEACFRLCHVTTQTEELASSQMQRRVLVPARNLQQELLGQLQAAHSKSRDPKFIEASVKQGLSARAKAYADFESSSEDEIGKLIKELTKLSASIAADNKKMKDSGLYPSRHYYPGIHPVDPHEFAGLKRQHSNLSATLRELKSRREINARNQKALYDLLKGLDPSLKRTRTLGDAVLSVKLKSLGESKASPDSPSSYFIQVGPTAMSLTPLPNGELDRIDLREPGGESYSLACDARGTNAVSSLEKPYENLCTATSALASLVRSTHKVTIDEKAWKKLKKQTQELVDAGPKIEEFNEESSASLEESSLDYVIYNEWRRLRPEDASERQRLAFIKKMEVDKVIPPAVQKILDGWSSESRKDWVGGWPNKRAIYQGAAFASDALEEEDKNNFAKQMKELNAQGGFLKGDLRQAFDKEYAERQEAWIKQQTAMNEAETEVHKRQLQLLEAMALGEETRSIPKDVYFAAQVSPWTLFVKYPGPQEDARYRVRTDANSRYLEIVPASRIRHPGCDGGVSCDAISDKALTRFLLTTEEARALKEWIDKADNDYSVQWDNESFPLKGTRMVEFCRSLGLDSKTLKFDLDAEVERSEEEKAVLETILQDSRAGG